MSFKLEFLNTVCDYRYFQCGVAWNRGEKDNIRLTFNKIHGLMTLYHYHVHQPNQLKDPYHLGQYFSIANQLDNHLLFKITYTYHYSDLVYKSGKG